MINIVQTKDLTYAFDEINKTVKNKESIKKIFFNDTSSLINEINQIDIFSQSEVFFILNNHWFESSKSLKQATSDINQILQTCEEYQIYFFYHETQIDEKLIKQAFPQINIIKLPNLTIAKKNKLIESILNEHQVKINSSLNNYLVSNLPNNYGIIKQELNKVIALVAYNNENEILVQDLICNWQEANIFALLEAILNKNTNEVWHQYTYLKNHNEDEIMIFNSLITNLINLYFILYNAIENKKNATEIAKTVPLPLFVISNYINRYSSINNLNFVKKIIHDLSSYEIEIKQNNNEKTLLLKNIIMNWLKLN